MATIKSKITIGDTWIITLENEIPTDAGGTYSPIGSQALVNSAGFISMWLKTGVANSAWTLVFTTQIIQ